jgi:predicted Zn-dependent peptidase
MRRAILLLCAVAAVASVSAAARPWETTLVKGKRGAPNLVVAERSTPLAAVVVRFATGSVDDGIRSGLTRLSQHMMVECNRDEPRGALLRDVYAAGGELRVETDLREARFVVEAPAAALEPLIPRLLRATLAPRLDKGAFSRCKRLTLLDELVPGSSEDMHAWLAGSVLHASDDDEGADYSNRPYGDPDVVRGLGFADVSRHVSRRMAPARATVVVVGPWRAKEARRWLKKYRGGRARKLERPDISRFLPLERARSAPRPVHMQAQLVNLDSPQAVAAARLLAPLLEERLRVALRERKVTGEVSVAVLRREWMDWLAVEVRLDDAGFDAEPEVRRVLDHLEAGSAGAAEVERNRAFALEALARDERDPRRLANALSGRERGLRWHDDRVRKALEDITSGELLSLIQPWVRVSSSIVVRYGAGGEP